MAQMKMETHLSVKCLVPFLKVSAMLKWSGWDVLSDWSLQTLEGRSLGSTVLGRSLDLGPLSLFKLHGFVSFIYPC
jgi:hypothetical protein